MHALSTNRALHVSSIGLTTNFCIISLEAHVYINNIYCTTHRYRYKDALHIFAHFTRKYIPTQTVKCIFNECTQTFVNLIFSRARRALIIIYIVIMIIILYAIVLKI